MEPSEILPASSKVQLSATIMQHKLIYLLTAILLSFFAVQCNDISDPGGIETESQPEDQHEAEPAPDPGSASFVSARNGDFHVDGQSFRYAGTNAYYLQTYENIEPGAVDRAFNAFENAGITVVRTWGYYDGPAEWNGDAPIQPRAGEYSEENLKLLDKVIAQGKEKGIRFIVTLTNFYPDLGGICQYNLWAGVPEAEACDDSGDSMALFMNGSEQQKLYKNYIDMLLNRVNTETGVAYKNEPAIFSWEIINEGRNPGGDPQELRDWYQEIAQYIKSIDSNHMVSTGEEGFENGEPSEYSIDQYANTYILRSGQGTSYLKNTAIPEIDYASAHWYPSGWGMGNLSSWGDDPETEQGLLDSQTAWLSDHARIAEDLGKPFLLGEYGYSGWGDERVKNIYDHLWKHAEDIQLDGSLLWQLTADHVKCYEYGGNICWPGGRADEALYNGFIDHIQAMDAQ